MDNKPEHIKKKWYKNIIAFYVAESPVYVVLNNTIRYSTNTEGARPVSNFVKYLHDAIRYYFTTQYKSSFDKVYRGARISLIEQRSFVEKRYIRNLGFMSTSRS